MRFRLLALTMLLLTSFTSVFADEKNVKVRMETTHGVIELELFKEAAPISVENFVSYVGEGFYEDTIFHRVIKGFMIQGGGMDDKLTKKPTKAPIQNEATNGLKNNRGTIAMARTSKAHSATSQFFINTVNNDFLNHSQRNFGYAVFGKVTKGMDVMDKIEGQAVGNKKGYQNVPVESIVIKKMSIIK